MGNILAFARITKTVTLDGFGQNHSRCTLVIHSCVIRRINLLWIMTASTDFLHHLVGEVFNHLQNIRIRAKKVLANIRTI